MLLSVIPSFDWLHLLFQDTICTPFEWITDILLRNINQLQCLWLSWFLWYTIRVLLLGQENISEAKVKWSMIKVRSLIWGYVLGYSCRVCVILRGEPQPSHDICWVSEKLLGFCQHVPWKTAKAQINTHFPAMGTIPESHSKNPRQPGIIREPRYNLLLHKEQRISDPAAN